MNGMSREIHWDHVIPAVFFAASAICWYDPSMAPSMLFSILAFGCIFVSPVAAYFTRPVAQGLSEAITDALNALTDKSDPVQAEQTDRLFSAVADLIARSFESSALMTAMKESIISSLLDDDLHDAFIVTSQTALLKASENEGFRSTALETTKRAFTGALSDGDFVKELMTSIVGAIVNASKEEELTQSMLDVMTEAVSRALANERFVAEIKEAIKEVLRDGDLYKAGARGMVSAAFGRKKSANDKKDDATQASTDSEQSTARLGCD